MSVIVNKRNTNVERIIAKIDNDFNPDNSDWIPRVGAWCIDAMSQLEVLRTKRKRIKVNVNNRVAYGDCPMSGSNLKVYDENGCLIKEAEVLGNRSGCCGNISSTGEEQESDTTDATGTTDATNKTDSNSNIVKEVTPDTIDLINTGNENPGDVMAETVNDKYPYRYNYHNYTRGRYDCCCQRNYVRVDDCKLELNFDAKFIYVEMDYIEVECSEKYGGCELPVIPNNGLLIEAITYYCMYKMLCRGYKHPVFNLSASQYGTNPYYIWTQLKEEAKNSVTNAEIDANEASKLFRANFFINTFDPRR